MFTPPNVHAAASSAMALAFRNAAQPLGPVLPVSIPVSAALLQRLVRAWSAWRA